MRTVLIATLLAAASAQAQYSIDWYSIDGGGGTSTGGAYTVSGTIGQPDAGRMSGGNYTLEGGFWSMISVIQTPGSPLLTIAQSAPGTVLISWPSPSTGFQLQYNTDLNSTNWLNSGLSAADNGTTKTVTVSPALGNQFYRLKKP